MILDKIQTPGDISRFNDKDILKLSNEIREKIKLVVSENGGHLASNLGVVELTIALHRVFDFSSDKLIWDVGHQSYVHKLLTGRADKFSTNRTKGGISGFPNPDESEYDVVKSGHSSSSISTAVGLAASNKILGRKRKTVAVIGDGALTGGMAFEGLINAGELKSNLIVVLNDNGTFIDTPVGSMHKYLDRIRTGSFYQNTKDKIISIIKKMPLGDKVEKTAEHLEHVARKLVTPGYIFEDLGFEYFGPIDGHNHEELETMLERLSSFNRPVLLHVLTQKGGGWEPSESDPRIFHGPKGFDTDTGLFTANTALKKTYSEVFSDTMKEIASKDDRLCCITAAMSSGTGLRDFAKAYPDKLYDVGICEQHSFAFAQGLAIGDLKPILAHYSTFAQRGFDQLFQEFVLQKNLGIVLVLDRAGCVGEDGETHQGIYDISWTRCFPGLVIMAPKDAKELREMLLWSYEHEKNKPAGFVIRYPKEPAERDCWNEKIISIKTGKAEVLLKGDGKLMVWAYGAMVSRAYDAIKELDEEVVRKITLVNARFVKPFDEDLLKELSLDCESVITIEDHAVCGGFGSTVLESMSKNSILLPVTVMAIKDDLISHAKREEQLKECGLDVQSIKKQILLALNKQADERIEFVTDAK